MDNEKSVVDEYVDNSGIKYIFEYINSNSFDDLDKGKCTQAYGVCFYGDAIVIGYGGNKGTWGLIGGTIEEGETFEETLIREIGEESNMKVISYLPIGYQKVTNTSNNSINYQLRFVCIVEPFGPFVSDPAGSITEIKLIDPKDYKQYFDWGQRGDRIMSSAMEARKDLL